MFYKCLHMRRCRCHHSSVPSHYTLVPGEWKYDANLILTFKSALYCESPYGAGLGGVPWVRGVHTDILKLPCVIVPRRMDLLSSDGNVEGEHCFNSPLTYFYCRPFSDRRSVSMAFILIVLISADRRNNVDSMYWVEEYCWNIYMFAIVSFNTVDNSEVEEAGPAIWRGLDILCGFELKDDPPLHPHFWNGCHISIVF